MLPPAISLPPWRFSGVVYSALLNHLPQLQAIGNAAQLPPYKAPPQAPVLMLRPRNSLSGPEQFVLVPHSHDRLQVGATLGIVVGRAACRLTAQNALAHMAGYTIVSDFSLPHDGPQAHYRPGVRFHARDGFCCISPQVVAASEVAKPDALAVQVFIDGALAQQTDTGARQRDVARLLADVTEFMSLQPGDLLLLGASYGAPTATAGQRVTVAIEGLGELSNHLVAENTRTGPPT